jgi:predicted nucleic acid-binding protein
MRLVVDASVVVQVTVSGGELGPLQGHDLMAPPLLPSEVTSVLCELAYRGEMPAEAARTAVGLLTELPIKLQWPDELHAQAWETARSLGWAKSYDAEYVALARLLDASLLTIDARLARAVGHLVTVIGPTDL